MSDTDSSFPSITFPATFEGTAAIGADFSATMKFKTSNGPKVLEDLKALPRGTYDMTIVSRQAALAGDSVDREWAEMTLLDGDASELVYEKTCLGARCPVFAVHSSGEFEGRYVCEDGADAETYMEVVHGETRCPRFAASDAGDDVVDELATDPWLCPDCHGEGRLPDKTGGGHHKCKACDGTGHHAPSCDNCTTYGDCNISQPLGSETMGCGGKTWIHGEMMGELPIEDENTSTYGPDTMTVKELAEEFGALVIAAGDVDQMNEADAARYNVLSDELTARGRNPHDWRRIAEDAVA